MRSLVLSCLLLSCISSAVLSQTVAVPLVYQPLIPAAAAPGGEAFTLTVSGTGFVAGASVLWNGFRRPTTFVSGSQLQAAISAGDIAKAGTAIIRVANPGRAPRSNIVFLPIRQPANSVQLSQTQYLRSHGFQVALGDFDRNQTVDAAIPNTDLRVTLLSSDGHGTLALHQVSRTGHRATAVVAADFNNDGTLDLATADVGYVSILLGEGGGSFQPHHDFPVNATHLSIATADFNQDGKLDVAVLNGNVQFDTVSILLGQGDGSLSAPTSYRAGRDPMSVAVGDFDGDGHIDLAVANSDITSASVSILLGNGDGTFRPRTDYATDIIPVHVVAADFNGDKILDLAVATHGNSVSVLLGNGDGTFQPRTDYPVGSLPGAVGVGDLNGDGKLDVLEEGIGSLDILLGNGDGTFRSPITITNLSTESAGVALADFNNDGKLDVLTGDGYIFLQTP